jgi:DNA polymerase-3 subunit beta
MKIIVLKTNLIEAINTISGSISESVNLPILKNFLLKVTKNEIFFYGTNLEIAVKHKISGKILEEGEVVVPFSVFNSTVRNLNSERITLETDENRRMVLITDSYKGKIQDQDPKEFPIIPTISEKNTHLKIKTNILKSVFEKIIPSVQYSTIRPEISGIYIKNDNGYLVFVGTDSFRLVEIKLNKNDFYLKSELKSDLSTTIPLKTCSLITKMFDKDEDVDIFIDQNQIMFKSEETEVISRIIDGNYPDYKAVMPKSFGSLVYLNREEFLNAVKLVSGFSGRANDITIKTEENGKYLEVVSSNPSLGEGLYKIPIKLKGNNFSIIFNWKYIIDGLKIYDSEEVELGINSLEKEEKASKISSITNPNISYIVMPING